MPEVTVTAPVAAPAADRLALLAADARHDAVTVLANMACLPPCMAEE